jgi:hypothetical protein
MFSQRASNLIDVSIERHSDGSQSAVLAFRYVKYDILLDDQEWVKRIIKTLQHSLDRPKEKKGPVEMPQFYSDEAKR